MSKLHAAISFKHRVDEVRAIQKQTLKENIAGPIVPINIIDHDNNSSLENPINLENQKDINNIQDDDLDDENDESQVSSNWNSLINMWEQLLLQEEKAEQEAAVDINIDDNEISLENNTHPVLDNEAK
jgi:hypothetical protein